MISVVIMDLYRHPRIRQIKARIINASLEINLLKFMLDEAGFPNPFSNTTETL